MNQELPFSQAAENNKAPIQEILDRHLPGAESLLEIGSGTAQHAVAFAQRYPKLVWQCSDIPLSVSNVNRRIEAAQLSNLPLAIPLDVTQPSWPEQKFNTVYTANSLHIMSAESVEQFFSKVGAVVNKGGKLLIYGPFKYGGEFTTESNARFDLWLKDQNPHSGIRDFEWVNELATATDFDFEEDNAMPANNQFLVWSRR